MTKERFNELLDELDSTSLETLKTKNAKYAPVDDALHNFHKGASIDGSTTAQTIWHYMKKHFVSLMDKVERNDWEDLDDAKEKIQDIINYLRFMWCAANEDNSHYCDDIGNDDEDEDHDCGTCKYGELWDDSAFKREEDGNLVCLFEPCASCKNNFIPLTEDYNSHKNNWER